MRKIIFLTLVSVFAILFCAQAQNIVMGNGTVSTCGGNFYDSGNTAADYGANENFTFTICSDVPGKCVSLQFTSFELENNFDFLYVYNGPSASSPLIGAFTGTASPGTITAASGCLTVKFASDYTVNKAGWAAILNCSQCPVTGCPTCSGGIPPANDACAGAQNLGALPVPVSCPVGLGLTATFNTSNICATPEIPYNALQGCTPIGSMATPASDVWYKFTITAPILKVTINGMITPEVGLYSGSGCSNLVPRGCAIGGGGLLNATFSGLSAGTYYLQVSGGTLTDQCNFTLSLQNNLDCQGCVTQSTFTATPPPSNGIYLAGQTVNFCLQITGYLPSSANWLHAVIPSFGQGWDTSTIAALPPSSCSGNGNWGWYNHTITSTANGALTVGPGFFYETSAGNALGVADTNPGNNFGDNLSGNCTWNFCFSIKTKNQADCIQGQNLNVLIDTYGDGESGSWTSVACAGDPVNDFYASLACCISPAISVTNPVCNGQLGSAIGTGLGSGPWTYQWKNAAGAIIRTIVNAGTDQITNLAPGNYSLVTIDALGCDASTVFVVTEPQILHATVVINNTKCALNNGIITFTATGGTALYLYSVNNGVSFQAADIFRNLAAGIYTIILKDAHLCTWDTTVTIAASTFPVINNITTQNITCNNGDDGIIDIVATSGTPPYQYSIDNGASFQSSPHFDQSLTAITYQVVVSDVNGCTATDAVALTQPPPIDLEIIIQPANCAVNDGTILLNILSGATGAVSYSITNGQSFQSSNLFTALAPGIYFIAITDQNGCLAHDTAIVNNLNAPVINNVTGTDLTCNLSADGNINIVANGGTGALQYSINNGLNFFSTNLFNNLTAGIYNVVIKDQNNCRSTRYLTLTEPLPIIIKADIVNPTCGLSNGVMSLHPDNGVLPLEYSMDGGITWQSSPIINNLPFGAVTVMARDANGCIGTRTYQIVATSTPSVSSLNITDASCYGAGTGAVIINTVGGTPPIRYSIDGGITFSNLNSFITLAPGTYNLTLKDNAGCISDSSFSIAQPSQINLSVSHIEAKCGLSNGSITSTASGGTGILSYSDDGGLTFGAANVFNNLSAGSYKVVVMDANGCVEATTVIVNDALGPRITAIQTTPQICDDVANGSISLTAVSGTGILQYSIDNGITFSTNPDFLSLFAGNYSVYVKDANGCLYGGTVTVNIFNSPQINQVATTDASCNGFTDGTILINASGGNGNLQYSINNGTNYFASNSFNSLTPATYYLVVLDTSGCNARDTITIAQPQTLALASSAISEKCNRGDGSIQIQPGGGVPNYLYSLNNGAFGADSIFTSLSSGNYSIVVMDNNACVDSINVVVPFSAAPQIDALNFSNAVCNNSPDGSITINASGGSGNLLYSNDNGFTFQASNTFNNLSANNYSVSIIDTNNCRADSAVTITEPPPFNFSFQSVKSNCNVNNGSVTVTVSGGTGALTYSLNSGAFSSDSVFINLGAGNYTITVKDAVGCTQDFIASVNNYNGPTIQSVNSTDLTCNGINSGTISIVANGGSGSLQYSIDNGNSFLSVASYSDLPPATYNIVVIDTAGCEANNSVTISQPEPISILYQTVNAACGQSNGKITLSVSGGTGAYQYSIDSVTFQSSPVFNNLLAGSYQVVVKDAKNCVATENISIINLLAPSINSIVPQNLICNHDNSGQITIFASGGTGILSYSMDNGATFQASNIFNSLNAGTYYVSVKDANNCSANSSEIITEPDSLLVNSTLTDETCSSNNGSIVLLGTGGTAPYLFSSDSGYVFSAQTNYSGLNQGSYNIAIKDNRGCKTFRQITLNDLEGPQITNYTSSNVNCFGGNDGSISLFTSGGNGTLLFSSGLLSQQSNVFSNLTNGNYVVTVTDTNGCFDTVHVAISQPQQISFTKSLSNPKCNGSSDGTINIIANGGIPSYDIAWSNGVINNFALSNLATGTYYFTITDSHSCEVNDSIFLSQPEEIVITHIAVNSSCAGSANASASVIVTGGTLPYGYEWSPVSSNTNYVNNLVAGNYTVTVTDAHACSKNHSILISNPAPLTLQLQTSNVSCYNGNNGVVNALAGGGTPPYLYNWDDLNATESLLDSLAVGIYSVVITDSNGCTLADTASISSPAPINVYGVIRDVSCYGFANGSITLTTSGGVSPYIYNWSNGTLSSGTNNLTNGIYAVTITDANNCVKNISYLITQPEQVIVTAIPADTICIGQQTSLTCTATGGNGIYTYAWNIGQSLQNILVSPSLSTNYSVLVTDSNGCISNTDTSFVFVHPPLQILISTGDTICQGDIISIGATGSGGNGGPYFYLWNPFYSTSPQVTVHPDTTTTYIATVSDQCTTLPAIDSLKIVVNSLPIINFTAVPSEGCMPLTVHFVNQSITPPGSLYDWNFDDGTINQSENDPIHVFTASGSYAVTLVVTTPEFCKAELTIPDAVNVYPLPEATFSLNPQTASIFNPQISFTDESSLAANWHWNFGDGIGFSEIQNPVYLYSDTGKFKIQLIVSSEHLCFDTTYNEVIISGEFTLYIPNTFTPNNDGKNDFFFAVGYDLTNVQLLVFNRWGDKVFEGNNTNAKWNGKENNTGSDSPQGVYVYKLQARDLKNKKQFYEGKVNLAR